jgi:hypothetical protein
MRRRLRGLLTQSRESGPTHRWQRVRLQRSFSGHRHGATSTPEEVNPMSTMKRIALLVLPALALIAAAAPRIAW